MPIYEYRCQNCATQIEVTQRMSDAPLVHCDACGQDALKKLISATSFVLKGTGWYQTDYKAGGKGEPKAETKAESSGESKTESKPEAKTETKSDSASAPASTTKSD